MTVTEERAGELASMPYADYLQTPEWKERSAAAKARAGHRCQVCNSPHRLEAHHRTYERRGRELDADLTVLCDGCHERHHAAGRIPPAGPSRPRLVVPRPYAGPAPAPLMRRRGFRRRPRAPHRSGIVNAGLVLLVLGLGLLALAILTR